MIKKQDAIQVLPFAGIIKGDRHHEAIATGSEAPERKKSVRFAIDCSDPAGEVKNPGHDGDLRNPEAAGKGEATLYVSAHDSPQSSQQQAACLVEQSDQADGAGQDLGSTLVDVSFTMNLEELPEEYKLIVPDEDGSEATVTDSIQGAEKLTNDKCDKNVFIPETPSKEDPLAPSSADDAPPSAEEKIAGPKRVRKQMRQGSVAF